MKLEQQVCSLDLAKRLKKLGVKQESVFHWTPYVTGEADLDFRPESDSFTREVCIAAFTVAELGEMLPPFLKLGDKVKQFHCTRSNTLYQVYYWDKVTVETVVIQDYTEADARAKMLIYLLENELLAVAERR